MALNTLPQTVDSDQFAELTIVDHRKAALAALKPFAAKLTKIYLGANSFDSDAWNLIGLADEEASTLLESCAKRMPHAGRLYSELQNIVALIRGAELVLEAKGDDRNMEEEGALAILSKRAPIMKGFAQALERQSLMESGGLAKEARR